MGDIGVYDLKLLGTGSDGNVTILSNTDLGSANVKNYASLTINNGVTLQGNDGMDIRITSLLTNNGTIHCNGKITHSANQGTLEMGGGGGSSIVSGGKSGTIGGTSTNSPQAVTNPLNLSSFSDSSTFGGYTGGNGTGGFVGGTGGDGGGALRIRAQLIVGTGTISTNGTAGGNAAAAGNSNGGGGGGGGSGGYLEVFCGSTISNQTLQAKGGNGGNGGSSNSSPGSGGGGGSGGVIYVISTSFSGTISATAGSGGSAGGAPSTDGVSGTTGIIVEITP